MGTYYNITIPTEQPLGLLSSLVIDSSFLNNLMDMVQEITLVKPEHMYIKIESSRIALAVYILSFRTVWIA